MQQIVGISAIGIIVALFGFLGQSAQASSQLYTYRLSYTSSNWSERLNIPKADPQLGQLNKVIIQIVGRLDGSARYANTKGTDKETSVDFKSNMSLYEPRGRLLAIVEPHTSIDNVGRRHSVGDKDLNATLIRGYDRQSEILYLTEADDLEIFQGEGEIQLTINGGTSARFQEQNQLNAYLNADSSAEISVEYVYD